MSSILAGIRTNIILTESCRGLDYNQRVIVEGIYNEFKPIIEATLTADQINQLFTNIEQGATAAGGNRTMLGKGIDAGKAVNQAIDNVGKWLQDTKPVQAFDQKFENLKSKISTKFPGLEKNLTAMGTWAKENPGKTAAIIGVLTTIAALAGGPAGGAIAGQILRGTTELLKGEKISTAVGKGVKTAAIGALAGYGIDKIGDMLSGGVRMVADNLFPGARKLNLSFSAYGTGPSTFQNIPNVVGRAEDLSPIQGAFNSAAKAWSDGDYSKAASLFQQAKDAAAKLSDPQFVAQLAKDQESRKAIISGAKGIMQASDAFAAAAQGAASGAGEGGLKKTTESRTLTEREVRVLFEGVMSWLGKKATNLTTKVTADKLNTAWEKAGKPTESGEIATLLVKNGVPQDVMLDVFAKMKIPTTATPAPAASPATAAKPLPPVPPPDQPAAAPAQPAQAAQQPAQAAPAAKSGKPVIKQPSVANNRTAGVRQQGGTFAYNPLAEDAEKLAQLEAAMKQAQQITRAIKYDDSTTEIIVKIQELAQRTGIDPRSVKYAINDVYEAKSALESAVYGLDELFKDAYQEAKWKHDDEQEGISEEEKKPKTAKALIYQTDMYGAKGYYAECKEPGCDHKTKTYDRAVQAQNAIKKHHQEHFKNVGEGYRAGASGGSGLGIEKSPMEKVLEKPLGEMEELDEYDYTKRKPYAPVTHGETERDLVYMDRILNTLPKGLSIEEVYRSVRQKFDKMNKDLSIEQQVNAWKNIKPFIWRTYTNTWNLKEDAMADQFYDEFLHSSFKPDTPSYLDNLKGIKSFLMAKRLPDDKAKFLLRRLIQKIKPEMESAIMKGLQTEVLKHDASK